MDKDQTALLLRLTEAVEGLTAAFQRAARPTVIVTHESDCELVQHYLKNGYPVYFPQKSAA